jgi:hypothetical protein
MLFSRVRVAVGRRGDEHDHADDHRKQQGQINIGGKPVAWRDLRFPMLI